MSPGISFSSVPIPGTSCLDAALFVPTVGGEEGGPVPVALATGIGAPLTCLFRNNCTQSGEKLVIEEVKEGLEEIEKLTVKGRAMTPSEKKRACAIKANIMHLVKTYGEDRCGFLTITAPEEMTWQVLQRRYHSARTHLLSLEFVDFITVLEFQKNGRPHFHLVVVCKEDIRTGFNWEHYDAVRAWKKEGKKGLKPIGSLNPTIALVNLWAKLREKLPLYGLAQKGEKAFVELTPIKSTAEAIGYYVGGYVTKSLGNRKPEHKGARFVRYSQNCPRIFRGAWAWNNVNSWLWRAKLRTWANHHGCDTMEKVPCIFGPRWAYHHKAEILSWPLSWYPTLHHAAADGQFDINFLPDGLSPSDMDMDSPMTITRTGEGLLPPGLQTWRISPGAYNLEITEKPKKPWEIEEEKRQLEKHLSWLREKSDSYRCDVIGSSDSLSPTKGACDSNIELIQEGTECGEAAGPRGSVPVGSRGLGSVETVMGPHTSLGSARHGKHPDIHDSGNRPRSYTLRKDKNYPKFHRQPVLRL